MHCVHPATQDQGSRTQEDKDTPKQEAIQINAPG